LAFVLLLADAAFAAFSSLGGSAESFWRKPSASRNEASGTFAILDNLIDSDTFKRMLKHAGTFIGLARWRPQKGGLYGRFAVKKIVWNGKEI
jgi:hypothetical protein